MAKKEALTANDKEMKRKADEIHPCKDKAPFDIARELLSHFEDPPPFHSAEEDSTLAESCELCDGAINDVIIFLQDQAGAAAEVLSLGSLLASEEVKLVAQRKFLHVDDMVIHGDCFATSHAICGCMGRCGAVMCVSPTWEGRTFIGRRAAC